MHTDGGDERVNRTDNLRVAAAPRRSRAGRDGAAGSSSGVPLVGTYRWRRRPLA